MKLDEVNIRVYRKDRDTLANFGTYNEPMKKILHKILTEYQELKAKKLFEIKHGKGKRNF